jgi:hypothetical protein
MCVLGPIYVICVLILLAIYVCASAMCVLGPIYVCTRPYICHICVLILLAIYMCVLLLCVY